MEIVDKIGNAGIPPTRETGEMNNSLLADCADWPLKRLDPTIHGDIFAALPTESNIRPIMKTALFSLLLGLLGCPLDACAYHLSVNGTVTEYGSLRPVGAARVRIYKDGKLKQVLHTNAAGRYSVTLDNHSAVVLRVDAPGFQLKCITIDTHGPEWEGDKRGAAVDVEMRLPRLMGGMDLSFFDLPVGMAQFDPSSGLVQWNLAYEARVNRDAREVMQQYEQLSQAGGRMAAATDPDLGAFVVHGGR